LEEFACERVGTPPLIQSTGVTRDAIERALKMAGDSKLKEVKAGGVDLLPAASVSGNGSSLT
jgi:hypothetical protein